MTTRRVVPAAVLVGALILAVFAAVRLRDPRDKAIVPQHAGTQADVDAAAAVDPEAPGLAEPAGESTALRRLSVLVYYPSPSGRGLVGEPREIFETTSAGDRAKQILSDLISGPSSDKALAAVPPGTRLRQIYVMADGVAWCDFSRELRSGLGGGSAEELTTVYAIVDSLALNIREIRRVGFLIDGQPVDTFTGHVDLRRPLPPMRSMIWGEVSLHRGEHDATTPLALIAPAALH